MRKILVLGSLNVDLVQRVARLPAPGETLHGEGLQIFAGGKGANQACAAALLGGDVAMAGKVGSDVFGDRVTAELQNAGVDTTLVQKSACASGSAMIFVLPSGENMIVISAGANGDIPVEFARKAVEHLREGDFLLCQLETPLAAVMAAVKTAHHKGVNTILDPAPACELHDDFLRCVKILTPNQTEAAMLLGAREAIQNIAQAEAAARDIQSRGPKTVIVKMGAEGCVAADGGSSFVSPGFQVDVMDTTAAGDTFNGALAVALAKGETLSDGVRFANAAAALSVTKPGAIGSIPRLSEVAELLARA